MLEEALRFLKQQAIDAAGAEHCEFTPQPGLGDHIYLITNPSTGSCVIHDASPKEHGTVASINDLVIVAKNQGALYGVYVGSSKAVLQLEDKFKPQSRYVLPLRVNPIMQVLASLCANLDHKTCMRRLRVDLASAHIEPMDFKTSISALKFTTTTENATAVRKGDESIGKSIMSKVTGESDIAEEIDVMFPVYPDVLPGYTSTVKCSVIVDSMDQRISIIPIPGQLERAQISSQTMIAEAIKAALDAETLGEVPVICGTFCE